CARSPYYSNYGYAMDYW
nr:immunoglobulin heavy chain junction region [Mus musculus]MBK4187432.1 immunoglobulin heavy chain junction region [Mus musculus]MBK4187433.1 immunoglobulin heavy chain junction region [Mus musculus]MBK4187434.1 immunoglobulin heavy chain junction region [Mus musculus]MBK4187435.1 immunoglobulin heavy chain junction region [Mus musculus]